MKITRVAIAGFGVWAGLNIEGVGDGLNVLFGPNEAGKSTLLQFIRGVLYGFSGPRRRYLPPMHGGTPGGMLEIVSPHGRFEVERRLLDSGGEELQLTAADGTRHGEHYLKVLLGETDEASFNSLFAVGLREMQELGTLSDSEAAARLYNLSVGIDHVALAEVMRELAASRNRLLDGEGQASQIAQLLAQRDRLHAQIEELAGGGRRYWRLLAERNELGDEIARLEEDARRWDNEVQLIDLAVALGDRWGRRAQIDRELHNLGSEGSLPDGAIERFETIAAKMQRRADRIAALKAQFDETRAAARTIAVNDMLLRHAPRVEALREQEGWLVNLQTQVAALEEEIASLEKKLAEQRAQFGIGQGGRLPPVTKRMLAALRGPSRAVHAARQRRDESLQAAEEARTQAQEAAEQLEQALRQRQASDLGKAIDEAGGRVAQLRRRVQIDDRLDQLTRYQTELEEESRGLLEKQLLPMPLLAGLGVVFALGVMLFLLGLTMSSPLGNLGIAIACLGVGGSAAAAFGKWIIEKSNAQRFQNLQKQLGLLQSQLQQAKEDRDTLDRQLPRGGGPIAGRLQAAEDELAGLEALLPLESQRSAGQREAEAAAARSEAADSDLAAAKRRWREALRSAGLPQELNPKQLQQLARQSEQTVQWQRTLAARREEVEQRHRELTALTGRIAQLAADANVAVTGTPLDQLRQLGAAIVDQEAAVARRAAARRTLRQSRRQRRRHEEALGRWKHRRRKLLLECGVESEQGLREVAARVARITALRQEQELLDREIDAAVAGRFARQALVEHLDGTQPGERAERRERAATRAAAAQAELKARLEKRGQLSEHMAALAADRQLGHRQLELADVEQRLLTAVRRWRVLATTCRGLDIVRSSYEHERQPETLQEASRFLVRMTQGRYPRVWTPFGQRELRVDDADGQSLAVEALSRGTREQLFLSLRMALAAYSARRGAPLPMVLDDVLVNFDAARAQAAAEVLSEFAASGHQVLVFTCHEHIMTMFDNQNAAVARLPANADPHPPTVYFNIAAGKRAKPPRETARKRRSAPREEEEAVRDEPEVEPVQLVEPPPVAVIEPEPPIYEPEPKPEPVPEPENEPADEDAPAIAAEEPDLVPLVPARKPKRRRRAGHKTTKSERRPAKPRGVFDADFFDSENEAPTDENHESVDDSWMEEEYDEDAPWEEEE